MPATNAPELRAMVAAAMHGATIDPFWNDLTRSAISKARSEVYGILRGRGYTTAQVDASDELAPVIEFQSLYWAGELGRAYLTETDSASLKALDQRAYLATMAVTNSGVIVEPAAAVIRQSASGAFGYPASGSVRNPLLIEPCPRRWNDLPMPGV